MIAVLSCSVLCNAQDSLKTKPKLVITLSLVTPTFSYAPRYTAGYIHRFTTRWWAGLEAGYGNYNTSFGIAREKGSDYITPRYKLYEIRPEVYYDLRPSGKLKHFVSAEFFYIHHKDHYVTSRFNGVDGIEYRFDAADYKRIKTGININYTLMFYFTKQFGLLSKTGFGIKRRDVSFSNVENRVALESYLGDDHDSGILGTESYQDDEGVATNFNFNFDMKLFYKF